MPAGCSNMRLYIFKFHYIVKVDVCPKLAFASPHLRVFQRKMFRFAREMCYYIFLRENKKGTQTEWWFHRSGCQSWFLVERDTTNNTDHKSFWYKDLKQKK